MSDGDEVIWECACGWSSTEAFGEVAMHLTDDLAYCPECGRALFEYDDADYPGSSDAL